MFYLKSQSGKVHAVDFGITTNTPCCTCKDWIQYKIPCKHFFAVFEHSKHIEIQAAASLFEMLVFICTTGNASQSEQGYTNASYNSFSPRKLTFPPPQERSKTLDLLSHIELCHTGGCHFDCVLCKELKFSLIQPKLHVMHIYNHTIL